jgi:crotonobetainyl-CoA:carnitine CoA-transferase CaiB-like acyl-CoA transferase
VADALTQLPPVQFDEAPAKLVRAPEVGEQTEQILQEMGLEWDRILELKAAGAIL